MSSIYLVHTSWVCSVPFFIIIYLWYIMYITRIYKVYYEYIIIKKGTEQTHEIWTRHIQDILVRTAYYWNMPCIYHVYTMHIPVRFWYTRFIPRILVVYTIYIYNVYLRDIHCIYNVYHRNIPCLYNVYLRDIHCILSRYTLYIHSISRVYIRPGGWCC